MAQRTTEYAKDHKESRILFSDMFLSNLEELKNLGLTGATEVKFENSISRTTAVAKPRQIERVVRGAQFPMQLIYEFSNDIDVDIATVNLGSIIDMLENDEIELQPDFQRAADV